MLTIFAAWKALEEALPSAMELIRGKRRWCDPMRIHEGSSVGEAEVLPG